MNNVADQYQVHVEMNGSVWPLRGTTWAFSMERAQSWTSAEDARKALEKAKPFMKAAVYKKARIVKI